MFYIITTNVITTRILIAPHVWAILESFKQLGKTEWLNTVHLFYMCATAFEPE